MIRFIVLIAMVWACGSVRSKVLATSPTEEVMAPHDCVNGEQDLLAEYWEARFGTMRQDPDIGPLTLLKSTRFMWKFNVAVRQQFPKFTKALLLSDTYDVRARGESGYVFQCRFAFWRARGGEVLAWALNTRPEAPSSLRMRKRFPSLEILAPDFTGFHRVCLWYMSELDTPPEVREYNSLLSPWPEPVDTDIVLMLDEFCTDAAFNSLVPSLVPVGHGWSGELLVGEPQSEELYCISFDANPLETAGAAHQPIGEGDACAFTMDRAPSLKELRELLGGHILQQTAAEE